MKQLRSWPTRYARLERWQAGLVLLFLLAGLVWFQAGAHVAPRAVPKAGPQGGDVALYGAIVERVRAGEGYYDAAGSELRARNYPVRPMFNWRQPTYAWVLSHLPSPIWANVIMSLMTAVIVWMTRSWVGATGGRVRGFVAAAWVGVTLLGGCCVEVCVYLQETWAAYFILLSVCCYVADRWRAAVALGLCALAFREFALLPCAVAMLFAVTRRRWPEVAAWAAGLAVYAVLMAWHGSEVVGHYRPGDMVRTWVAFGGSSFLISSCEMSPILMGLQRWQIALFFPLSLFGLAGWRDSVGARLAFIAFGYAAVFSVIGQPFNSYWGLLYMPILPFGLVWAPESLRDLVRSLLKARAPANASSSAIAVTVSAESSAL